MLLRIVAVALLSLMSASEPLKLSASGTVPYVENGVLVRTYMRALAEAESAARNQLGAKMLELGMDSTNIRAALLNATITGQHIRVDKHVVQVDMQVWADANQHVVAKKQ